MPFYQLDADKLRPGDVVLEGGPGKLSKLIKLADRPEGMEKKEPDRQKVSHALLYLGVGQIIEADQDVRTLSVNRIITAEPENYIVLRHPRYPGNGGALDWQAHAATAIYWALHGEANKPYNWLGAIGAKIPLVKGKANTFFCSQLVAEGYRRLGVPLFTEDVAAGRITPEKVTPNMFLTRQCVLEPVENCFHKLPDRPWVAELAANRYDVMQAEPVPLASITNDRAKNIVRTFGPRVDALTRRINKVQTISSPQELYITLAFPDLPEADKVSDELVEYMKTAVPTEEAAAFFALHKRSLEAALVMNDPEITSAISRTLRHDITHHEQLLPQMELAAQGMRVFPPPPFKRRSIHDWLAKAAMEAIATQKEIQQWRKALLARIEGGR